MSRPFDTPINTNDQSVERVLSAGLPVALVILGDSVSSDLDQSMNRLAKEYAGQLLVVKMSRQENPATVQRFGVNSTPTVVTLKKGQTVSQAESITGNDLAQHIIYLLGKGAKPVSKQQQQTSSANGVSGAPLAVTDATFDREVLQASQPVLVDLWAPWCGPCRMINPIVKKLASEYAGRLRVVKVNVDENPALSNRFGVQSIPTMMIFRNGQVADRWSGALPEPALRSRVQQVIGA